jgi:hypothetical protein
MVSSFHLRRLFCRTTRGSEQDAQKSGNRTHGGSREVGTDGKKREAGMSVHFFATWERYAVVCVKAILTHGSEAGQLADGFQTYAGEQAVMGLLHRGEGVLGHAIKPGNRLIP